MHDINWIVAYREKQDDLFDLKKPFFLLNNPWYGWAADPFLFTHNGITYIFAEIWNFYLQKGSIGYVKYEEGKFTKWKVVISEYYHMSYPFIWEDDKGIHLCAETSQIRQVYTYKAIDFPDIWAKESNLINDMKCADTTIKLNDKGIPEYLFTYEIEGVNKGTLYEYLINSDYLLTNKEKITSDSCFARPGGNFFELNNYWYRVAQNCGNTYGRSIRINKVKNFWPYVETIQKEIDCNEVTVYPKVKSIGMHTYNKNDKFEVVDFRFHKFHIIDFTLYWIIQIASKIKRMIIHR